MIDNLNATSIKSLKKILTLYNGASHLLMDSRQSQAVVHLVLQYPFKPPPLIKTSSNSLDSNAFA